MKMRAFYALKLPCNISGNATCLEAFTTVMFGKNRPYAYFACIRINWVSFFFLLTRGQSLLFVSIKNMEKGRIVHYF